MAWEITWSKQTPSIISTIAASEGGLVVSSGLNLSFYEHDGSERWSVDMPFKVHAIDSGQGLLGVLAAHGFYVMSTRDGSLLHEGRSSPGGFTGIKARPGGGWVLSGRDGNMHLFSQEGRGIRRMDSGMVRRLLGWLDREHLMWQASDGRIWCGRLTGSDKKRCLEDRIWSWSSELVNGRIILQSSDGSLWQGIPHPFGWDDLIRLEQDSIEAMEGINSADGWWVLGIEGRLYHLSRTLKEDVETLGESMDLGDILVGLTPDSMVTATRSGLIRKWSAPHLAQSERKGRFEAAAEAAMARNWEERKDLFLRAQNAEDEGKLSIAVELYGVLGRKEDVRRLLQRQKEGDE